MLSAESLWISEADGIHLVERSVAVAVVKTGPRCLGGTERESLCHPFSDGME